LRAKKQLEKLKQKPKSEHSVFLKKNYLFIYSYMHTLFRPSSPHPTLLASRQNLFCPVLQFCWREDISNNKKDIAFLLVWDKDNYTERFLALLPLLPQLIHLYLTSSLPPGHFPIVTSVSIRLLYSLLYSGHIKHFQVQGFYLSLFLLYVFSPYCVQ
jgi:hypothetical protein